MLFTRVIQTQTCAGSEATQQKSQASPRPFKLTGCLQTFVVNQGLLESSGWVQQSSAGQERPGFGHVKGELCIGIVAPVRHGKEKCLSLLSQQPNLLNSSSTSSRAYLGILIGRPGWSQKLTIVQCMSSVGQGHWESEGGASEGKAQVRLGRRLLPQVHTTQFWHLLSSPPRALQESLYHGPRQLTPPQGMCLAGWWTGEKRGWGNCILPGWWCMEGSTWPKKDSICGCGRVTLHREPCSFLFLVMRLMFS